MLVKMAKVEIVGLKSLFFDVLGTLQSSGNLHVEDLSKKMGPKYANVVTMEVDPALEEEKSRLQNLAMRNNAILQELAPPEGRIERKEIKEKYDAFSGMSLEDITSSVDDEEAAVKDLLNAKNELEAELSRLSKYEPIVKKIAPLAQQISATEHFTSIALLIEKRYKTILTYIEEELNKITNGQCDVVSADVDEETTAAIVVFSKAFSEEVHNFLATENVNQVRLPHELADKPYDEVLDEIKKRRDEIPPKITAIKKQLDGISKNWYMELVALKEFLGDRVDTLSAVPKFGQSGHVFVVTGWIPKDQVESTRKLLTEKFEGKVELTEEVPTHEELEEAPVALTNKPLIRPFEFIYMLIKPPKYGTADPTWLVAIFFPIFFGFMLGDIGYGLVLVGGVFLVKYLLKKRGTKSLFFDLFTSVMLIAGVSTTLFGILYLEFFGDLIFKMLGWGKGHVAWVWGHTSSGGVWGWPVERIAEHNKDMFTLILLIVFGIGALHLTASLVIGLVDAIHEKQRKHIVEKIGYLMFIWGLVIVFGTMWGLKDLKSIGAIVGVLVMLGGIVAAAYGGGFGGAIEAALTFGNILSYARLYGIGLASVILAEVANQLGAKFSGILIPVGIIVAVLLHTLNMMLGILSPSIQSLRLNLVESFTKFHKEAEVEYKPFKKMGGD